MTARDLYQRLLYQVLAPRVTTMGPCDQPDCDHYSRGSATCKHCLSSQLDAILDNRLASRWVIEQAQASATAWALEEAVSEVGR